jgi:NTE family protein
MARRTSSLAMVEAFRDLSPEEQASLEKRLTRFTIARGDTLIRQGEDSDALYLVVSGRFEVRLDGREEPVAEIGPGRPIGEIAFFTGCPRTANVVAERDSLVLKLTRRDFDDLAQRIPGTWRTITTTLARRLAATTAGPPFKRRLRPRTICLCRAGGGAMAGGFVERLRKAFVERADCAFLDEAAAAALPGAPRRLLAAEATPWFNEIESRHDYTFYLASAELSEWSRKAIRQADLVLLVGEHAAASRPGGAAPNDLERFAASIHKPANLRLALVHGDRGPINGTRAWLDARPWLHAHHHVEAGNDGDFARLYRFIAGSALGLVACGGGAFSASHIGMFEAFRERGIAFDIVGGTSGGAAMTGALALGADPDEIARRTHDIFVRRRAFWRWTWPRYSLLDHSVFDAALAEHYTSVDIEDLWTPFFAVSTNLTHGRIHCHRRGPLWRAIRASSAIPALLPPVYSDEGDMLVDGCLVDNVPVKTMQALKCGPNIVVDFAVPVEMSRPVESLPSRAELIRHLIPAPWRSKVPLPEAPSPQSVLMRGLMLNQRRTAADLGPDDLLLEPAMPVGIGHLDWHRHDVLRREARAFARAELDRVAAAGHPAMLRV